MSKLVFKSAELKDMVEHVVNTPESKLWLAKDQGVYFVSDTFFINEEKVIVYARGCNPNTDESWYDTAHDLVGGDDFGEDLTDFAQGILEQIKIGNDEVNIIVTANSIKIGKSKNNKNTLTETPVPTKIESVEEEEKQLKYRLVH